MTQLWNRVFLLAAIAGLGMYGCSDSSQTDAGDAAPQAAAQNGETALNSVEPLAIEETAPVEHAAEPAPLDPNQVTIYRDDWGVPHIYSGSDRGAAYGIGYAQAEDRLGDIYVAVRTGLGRMSEMFGKDYTQQDYAMRLLKNEELAKAHYAEAPAHLNELAEGYLAGVDAYLAENPDAKPEWAIDLEPWMLLTIGRAMILNWPLGTVQDELRERERNPIDGGSNQWAVAPSRTEHGGAILMTDPHLTWEGLSVFYEARVHGDKLHMNGYFLMGSPLLAFGHTNHIGWAPTTGGPDTADVYALTLNPENPMQYEYDGEWKQAQIGNITFPVKDGEPFTQMTGWTELGPVFDIDMPGRKAWVGASPYWDKVGLLEQIYNMCIATNADEFYEALRPMELMEQNIMFADTSGNIRYVRNGATPIRPEGYDYSKPVPGNTSETAWKGIHPLEDLVQILNPEQGYMQNCNISPENMMVNSPMTADKYLDYIFNVSWDKNNPRSKRAVALLDADDMVTREEAIAYTVDVYDILAEPWQNALRTASEDLQVTSDMGLVISAILEWDGHYTPDSKGTPFLKNWRLKCTDQIDVAAIAAGEPLSDEDTAKMLALLEQTVAEMKEQYGTIDLAWGDVHVVGRGGQYFPSPGADFGGSTDGVNFTETLFDVRYRQDSEDPKRQIANNGSMATLLMFFSEAGVESYSVVPWGQSGDPDSPHYMDQGEQLYTQRKLKPTWWERGSLEGHIKSEKVLTLP